MPTRAKKPCKHPGCPNITSGKYCLIHLPLHKDDYPRRIKQNGIYASTPWKAFRIMYLRRHPMCSEEGCNEMATVIDHIVPVNRGGSFWDTENLRALCKRCHDKKTAKLDGGFGNIKEYTHD